MIEGIPKISIIIITYKQEEVVKRTLNSLLAQKDYIFEICVSDDCSPDNTWEILQQYDKRYPGLFKLQRHPQNVGIFENIESTWTMPTGDLICRVAGDDECGEGWLQAVVDYIRTNKIDYVENRICIYGDFKAIYPNGDSILFKQKAIQKCPNDALLLAIRGIIGGRGCCFSSSMLKMYEKVSQGRSHIAEMAQDRQLQCFSEINYYIPYLANIYYTGIGVSSHLNEETLQERQKIIPYAINFFESKGIVIRNKEKFFLNYIRESLNFRYNKSISSFLKTLYYFLRGIDLRYSFLGNDFKFYCFAIIRRLPHRTPIHL